MSQPDAEFPSGGDSTATARYQANSRNIVIAYLLWFFLGFLGVHRFYLGRVFTGLMMLGFWAGGSVFTFILFGFPIFLAPWALWMLLDLFLIPGMVRAENNAVVDRIEGRG